ncbi:hypothetical protein C8R45DRAFT_927903 [Mycena sanguinolenta]|nr:hypothetical protein C8R45DRAFT_927903 [Mycena sanguinolenta]
MSLSDADPNSNSKSSSGRSRPEAENSMEVDLTVAPSSSTAPLVTVSESDAVSAERVHGGDDSGKRRQDRLRSCTRNNPWMAHPKFGLPVCVSALHPGNDGVFGCLDCREYMRHVIAAFRDDDADIRSVINKRDDIIASNRRTREEARLRGELAVTERTLEDANDKIDDLTRQVIELSTKCARAEQDRLYYFEDRERYKEELERGRQRTCYDPTSRGSPEGSRRKRGPSARATDQQDGEPLRKPTVPAFSVSETTAEPVSTGPAGRTFVAPIPSAAATAATPAEDVEMGEIVSTAPAVINTDWKHPIGLPTLILSYWSAGPQHIPAPNPGTWPTTNSKVGLYEQLKHYNEALQLAHNSRHWGVALSVIRVYALARAKKPGETLTLLEDHAPKTSVMPHWMGEILKKFFADKDAVEANKGFWPRMTRPAITDPDAAAAAWYQRQGLVPEYCPYLDDFHTLNARLFRGFRTWSVITGCPMRGMATANLAADDPVLAICKAVLHMLLVPDSYAQDLHTYGHTVEPEEKLTLWPRKRCEPADLSDGEISKGLADMGLQPTTVDDAYDYLCAMALEIASTSRVGWDVEALKNMITACDKGIAARRHAPPGKKLPYGAYLFHPPGLPWADKLLNGIQEKVVFLTDIPVPAPFRSNKLGRFNFIDASVNSSSPARASISSCGSSSRGRGGSNVGRGRGSALRARGRGGYAGMLPHPGFVAPPPYLQQLALPHSTSSSSQQQPAYWHGIPPSASSYNGGSLTPASHALQQQYNTATLFASLDAGFPYSSTSSSATPMMVSNAPAGFHGGNGTIPTQFSNLGLDYLGSSPDLQFPPH